MNSKNKTKKLLLLGILLFGFTASGWSQKVSLNFKDEKIEKVLSSIKSQTGMGHRTKRFFQWSGKMGERF